MTMTPQDHPAATDPQQPDTSRRTIPKCANCGALIIWGTIGDPQGDCVHCHKPLRTADGEAVLAHIEASPYGVALRTLDEGAP